MKELFYNVRKFFHSIHNLIIWFPIIWKDQQWDQYYFFLILRHKLIQMENFFDSKYCHHMESEKDVQNIQYCINRLNRIINDNYLSNALEPFNEKYPNYEWIIKTKPHIVNNVHIGDEWVDTDTEEQHELKFECYHQSDKDKEVDMDELFTQLKLHIEEFWD